MNKQIIITAALFGAIAVICGAFGAHALKAALEPRQFEVWQTAVQYQFYHVLPCCFCQLFRVLKTVWLPQHIICLRLALYFFPGSLYLLACRDLLKMPGLTAVGPVTPVGGLLFIIGWITLALAAFRNK